MFEFMSALNSRAADLRIRRARVDDFGAELDLHSRTISLTWQRAGKAPVVVGAGAWRPLPEPLGDLRGWIVTDCMERRLCTMLEYGLGRGDVTWSYEHGPWVTAERDARQAGVGEPEAAALRNVMWLFYRNRWPLRFAEGCGWGVQGHAPLIASALADPARARARWELLILTGALQWRACDGDLDALAGDAIIDDFYASP